MAEMCFTSAIICSLFFQVPWQGTGGNEKFFFENENVCTCFCDDSKLRTLNSSSVDIGTR